MNILISIVLLFLFGGCANYTTNSGKVVRVDPKGLYDTSMEFNPEDLHLVVEKMVSSMLRDKLFDGTPVIDVGKILIKTDEHIDTESITDSIRTMIIKSKRARFIDSSMRSKMIDELEYQQNSKYIDKSTAKKIGKQVAQGYMLDGSISTMKSGNYDKLSYFYKITLQLHNIETGTVDWMDEKEIRKIYKK